MASRCKFPSIPIPVIPAIPWPLPLPGLPIITLSFVCPLDVIFGEPG